jgi:hypothetical protein
VAEEIAVEAREVVAVEAIEMVKEMAKETAKETVKEAAIEVAKEVVIEAAKEAVREVAKEAVREVAIEAVKEVVVATNPNSLMMIKRNASAFCLMSPPAVTESPVSFVLTRWNISLWDPVITRMFALNACYASDFFWKIKNVLSVKPSWKL